MSENPPNTPAPAPGGAAPPPAAAETHGSDDGHHSLPFNPFIIFLILAGLTAVSYGADQMKGVLSLGTISALVMFVSVCKSTLVIGFFMHFKYEGVWKYVLTIPPLIMAVWIMCSLIPDIGNRMARHDTWTHRNAVKKAAPKSTSTPTPGHEKPAGGH